MFSCYATEYFSSYYYYYCAANKVEAPTIGNMMRISSSEARLSISRDSNDGNSIFEVSLYANLGSSFDEVYIRQF